MSAASLEDPQTLNLYAYCGNDPINHTDPDGLFFGKLFKWLGKAFKFIFKVAAIALFVVAMILLPGMLAAGGFWLANGAWFGWGAWFGLLGAAGAAGLAGWHNGMLGRVAGAFLTTLGQSGNFRTPSTFPNGAGVSGVNSFLQQEPGDRLPSVPRSAAEVAGQAALEEAILYSIASDAEKALKTPKCRRLIGNKSNAVLARLREGRNIRFVSNLKTSNGQPANGLTDNGFIMLDRYSLTKDPYVGATTFNLPGISTERARAVILLHELAHASGTLYGSKATQGHNIFSGRKINGSLEADQIIYQTCFGGKS